MYLRKLARMFAALSVLISGAARAQVPVTNTLTTPGFTPTQWQTGGSTITPKINCSIAVPGCVLFNLDACNNTTPINLSVRSSTLSYTQAQTSSINAWAWLQTNNGTCTVTANAVNPNATFAIPFQSGVSTMGYGVTTAPLPMTSAVLYSGGVTALDIPDDFGNGSFTIRDIMQAVPGVCDPNVGLPLTQWQICFGVPLANHQSINNSSVGSVTGGLQDVYGSFMFPIGTQRPAVPTITGAQSLVRRVQLDINYNAANSTYISGVNIIWTSDPNYIDTDCNTWPQGVYQTVSKSEATADTTDNSIVIPGDNGVTYAYCAQAVDVLGNRSLFSNSVQSSPHPECDFFDCYPGDLQVGYCGAALPPAYFGLSALAALARVLRRRRSL